MNAATGTAGQQELTPEQEEFLQKLRSFRDGLSEQQRDAFDAIIEAAAARTADEADTHGYFFGMGGAFAGWYLRQSKVPHRPEKELQTEEVVSPEEKLSEAARG